MTLDSTRTNDASGGPGPNEQLQFFIGRLPDPLRREICLGIVRFIGKRKDWRDPELAVYRFLDARNRFVARKRTVTVAGIIDHFMAVNTDPAAATKRWLGVDKAMQPLWREAQEPWLALRAAQFAPVSLHDFKRYRALQRTHNSGEGT